MKKMFKKNSGKTCKIEIDINDEANGTMELDENNLYVKGLWKECTQVELDDLFKQFGVITQSRVYGDGVGFVRFETADAAKMVFFFSLFLSKQSIFKKWSVVDQAIEIMHNKRIDSRSHETLLVKHAYRKVRNNKRIIRVGKE
ncbi:polyadenylate-binding protein 1, partial [Reticulomyxa filosa]